MILSNKSERVLELSTRPLRHLSKSLFPLLLLTAATIDSFHTGSSTVTNSTASNAPIAVSLEIVMGSISQLVTEISTTLSPSQRRSRRSQC